MQEPQCFVFEPFRLDVPDERLWRGHTVVPLPPKPFAILCCLVAQAGRLVTKDALLQAVWPETVVHEEVITVAIRQLRQILGDRAHTSRFIETVYGRGYRFIAPVVVAAASPDRPQTEEPRPLPLSAAYAPPRIFVGREAAMARVQQWWTTVLQGQRRIGFIGGEHGIGKTALVETFVTQIAATEAVWIGHGQCIDRYGAGEAYLPVLEALSRLCRETHGADIRAVLQQHAPTWLVHLPALLAPEDRARLEGTARGVTPAQMLRELADAIEVLSAARPLVLVLEDLHWSDRATLEWLAYVARRRDPACVLILGTYRPVEVIVQAHPLRPLLAELRQHVQCAELVLDYLSEPAVATYLSQRFTAITLPADLPRLLHQHTGGNPLFLIAMVDELVHQRLLEAGGNFWRGQSTLSGLVPAGLRQYIEQHVEQLSGEDQAWLEAASVAGSTFSVVAAAAGVAQAEATLEARYTALARQGRFVRAVDTETWPDGTVTACYQFLHAVYHEVVYARVSAGHRVRLHQQIGLRKEAGYGAEAPTIAAELAMHFTRARDITRAVEYLRHAANMAIRRQAYQEAMQHCTTGLGLLETLPDTAVHRQQELAMQSTLGVALMTIKGYADPDVARAYERARVLCQHMEDTPRLFPVLWGLWVFYFARGDLQTGRELGEQLLALADHVHDPALLLEAHMALGANLQHLGEVVMARTHLEQALALFDPQQHRAHAFLYGQDPQMGSLADLACILWVLGYPDQAMQRRHEALTVAQTVDHAYSRGLVHFFAAWFSQLSRNPQATAAHAEAVLTLAHEHAFHYLAAIGMLFQGWAVAMQGQAAEGIAQMRQGLAAYQAIVGGVSLPHFLALLAEAYGYAGQTAEGLARLAEALAVAQHTGDRWWEPELYRLQGEFLLMQSKEQAAQAETCFHQALAIARRQQARSLELRAAMSLNRLWQQQGKRTAARELLAAVYGWFTEGFDTVDLTEARVLLRDR